MRQEHLDPWSYRPKRREVLQDNLREEPLPNASALGFPNITDYKLEHTVNNSIKEYQGMLNGVNPEIGLMSDRCQKNGLNCDLVGGWSSGALINYRTGNKHYGMGRRYRLQVKQIPSVLFREPYDVNIGLGARPPMPIVQMNRNADVHEYHRPPAADTAPTRADPFYETINLKYQNRSDARNMMQFFMPGANPAGFEALRPLDRHLKGQRRVANELWFGRAPLMAENVYGGRSVNIPDKDTLQTKRAWNKIIDQSKRSIGLNAEMPQHLMWPGITPGQGNKKQTILRVVCPSDLNTLVDNPYTKSWKFQLNDTKRMLGMKTPCIVLPE
jgi:hypothetical protein